MLKKASSFGNSASSAAKALNRARRLRKINEQLKGSTFKNKQNALFKKLSEGKKMASKLGLPKYPTSLAPVLTKKGGKRRKKKRTKRKKKRKTKRRRRKTKKRRRKTKRRR